MRHKVSDSTRLLSQDRNSGPCHVECKVLVLSMVCADVQQGNCLPTCVSDADCWFLAGSGPRTGTEMLVLLHDLLDLPTS